MSIFLYWFLWKTQVCYKIVYQMPNTAKKKPKKMKCLKIHIYYSIFNECYYFHIINKLYLITSVQSTPS